MRDFISITKNTLPKKEFFFNFKKLSVHEELCFIIVIHFLCFKSNTYKQQPVETFERMQHLEIYSASYILMSSLMFYVL